MNKIVKTFAVLALLILLTMPALGAYNTKSDFYVAPTAAFEMKVHESQGSTSVVAHDVTSESGGREVVWKKWYVDGKIVSTDPNQEYLPWTFVYQGPRNAYSTFETHYITLRVANPANAANPSQAPPQEVRVSP